MCPWSLATSISDALWPPHRPANRLCCFHACPAGHMQSQAASSSVNQIIPVPRSDLSKDCPSKANKIPSSPLASPKPSTSFLSQISSVSPLPSHTSHSLAWFQQSLGYASHQGLCTCCFFSRTPFLWNFPYLAPRPHLGLNPKAPPQTSSEPSMIESYPLTPFSYILLRGTYHSLMLP